MGSIPITRSISQQFDTAGVAELADATDLKSVGWKQPYRFDSGPRHHQLYPLIFILRGRGGMADALASGASDGNIMEVQVLSTAPSKIFILYHAVVAELADALL